MLATKRFGFYLQPVRDNVTSVYKQSTSRFRLANQWQCHQKLTFVNVAIACCPGQTHSEFFTFKAHAYGESISNRVHYFSIRHEQQQQ